MIDRKSVSNLWVIACIDFALIVWVYVWYRWWFKCIVFMKWNWTKHLLSIDAFASRRHLPWKMQSTIWYWQPINYIRYHFPSIEIKTVLAKKMEEYGYKYSFPSSHSIFCGINLKCLPYTIKYFFTQHHSYANRSQNFIVTKLTVA